ncbi:hypothetical protein GOBAR_DD30376 [Gossypium barbadense]|nr:hypothetical protein GOBAR_DD30376 [Gossypium barbadense]
METYRPSLSVAVAQNYYYNRPPSDYKDQVGLEVWLGIEVCLGSKVPIASMMTCVKDDGVVRNILFATELPKNSIAIIPLNGQEIQCLSIDAPHG